MNRLTAIFMQHAVRAAGIGANHAAASYAAKNPAKGRSKGGEGGCTPCQAAAKLEAHRQRLNLTPPGGKRRKR